MTEDKQHQLDELKLSDILSYCVCRAFTTEEYIRGANKQIETVTDRLNKKSLRLTEAKDLIRNLLRVTYGEGWNYSLDWKVKAEQFLKETDDCL